MSHFPLAFLISAGLLAFLKSGGVVSGGETSVCPVKNCDKHGRCEEKNEVCHHGVCGTSGCLCDHCWKGPHCDRPDDPSAPKFTRAHYNVTLASDRASVIREVAAHDPDVTKCRDENLCPCGEVHYSILRGNDEGLFSVDPMTGHIQYTPPMTVTAGHRSLTVGAYSTMAGQRSTIEAVVDVLLQAQEPSFGDRVMLEPGDALGQMDARWSSRNLLQLRDKRDAGAHARHRRAAPTSLPTTPVFDLEEVGNTGSAVTQVSIGDVVSFKFNMWLPTGTTDLKLELFSPQSKGAFMSICSPTVDSVGSNFPSAIYNVHPKLDSKMADFKNDRATLQFDGVTNDGTTSQAVVDQKISVAFDVLTVFHPSHVNGTTLWVSAGVEYYNRTKVWVGQVALMYITRNIAASGTSPTVLITAPNSTMQGSVAVFTTSIVTYHASSDIVLHMFVANNNTADLSLCHAAIVSKGARYDCFPNEALRITEFKNGDKNYGLKLELLGITNKGFNPAQTGSGNANIITLEIYGLVSQTASAASVTGDAEIAASGGGTPAIRSLAPQAPAVTSYAPVLPGASPTMMSAATRSTIYHGEHVAVRVNITVKAGTTADYAVKFQFNVPPVGISVSDIRVIHVDDALKCLTVGAWTASDTNSDNANDEAEIVLGGVSNVAGADKGIVVEAVFLANSSIGTSFMSTITSQVMAATKVAGPRSDTIQIQPSAAPVSPDAAIEHRSKMHTEYLYDAGYTLQVGIYLPPGESIGDVHVNISLPPELTFCKREVDSGKHYGPYQMSDVEVEVNEHFAALLLPSVANIGPAYESHRSDNWLYVEYTVLPKSPAHQQVLNSSVNVTYSGGWFADSINVTYIDVNQWASLTSEEKPQPIADDPDPVITTELVSPDLTLRVNEVLAYDVTVVSPPRLIVEYSVVPTLAPNTEVCGIKYTSVGEHLTCAALATNQSGLNSLSVSNSANDPMVFGDHDANMVTYRFGIRHVAPGQTSGSMPGDITTTVARDTSTSVANSFAILADASAPQSAIAMDEKTTKVNSLNLDIPQVGSAVWRTDYKIPRGSANNYSVTVNIFKETALFSVCDVRVTSVGFNLPCVNHTAMTFSQSTRLTKTLQIGYVSNVARPGTDLHTWDTLTVETCIKTEGYAVGKTGGFTITLSDNAMQSQSRNVTVTATDALHASEDPSTYSVAVGPAASSDNWKMMNVGETATFWSNITLPPNSVVNVSRFLHQMTHYTGAARLLVSNVRFLHRGANFLCAPSFALDTVYTSAVGNSEMTDATSSGGILANSGAYTRFNYQDREPKEEDNVLTLAFDVRLTDHSDNTNGQWANMTFTVDLLLSSGPVSISGDAGVKIDSHLVGRPWFGLDIDIQQKEFLPGDDVLVTVDLTHTADSRAQGHNATVVCHIPEFATFTGLNQTISGLTPNVTSAQQYTRNPPAFQFDEFLFSDTSTFSFTFQLGYKIGSDPAAGLTPVTVPCEVLANYLDRTVAPPYSPSLKAGSRLKYDALSVNIEECIEPLGLESGVIQDCQITTSASLANSGPKEGRINTGNGWKSGFRREPFNGTDFLQVYFGNKTRVTAIGIQPEANSVNDVPTRIVIRYSYEGGIWHDYNGGNAIDVTVNASIGLAANDIVYVPLHPPVEIKYIRIVPEEGQSGSLSKNMRMELYGCGVNNIVSAQDVCKPDGEVVNYTPYSRGFLVNPTDSQIFVCMEESEDFDFGQVFCSYSEDLGSSWIPLPYALRNVIIYDPVTKAYYGVSRNLKTYLRSTGKMEWDAITQGEFVAANASTSKIDVKTVPYEDFWGQSGGGPQALTSYHVTIPSTNHKIGIDGQGIHLYDPSSAAWVAIGQWVDYTW